MKENHFKVGVVIRPKIDSQATSFIDQFLLWLEKKDVEIIYSEYNKETLRALNRNPLNFVNHSTIHRESDLIISLGGDGTLLGVCRKARKNHSTPIFGINLGNLGFITEFTKIDYGEYLEKTFKKQFETLTLPLFRVDIIEYNKIIQKSHFFNDVTIKPKGIARMLSLTFECDDEPVMDISGDGVIISSPTGSTAYSLAAGGPIVHPQVEGVIVTPICAHGFFDRSIMTPPSSVLKIRSTSKGVPLIATLDGQEVIEFEDHQTVIVSMHNDCRVNLVKNPERTFYKTLQEKFFRKP